VPDNNTPAIKITSSSVTWSHLRCTFCCGCILACCGQIFVAAASCATKVYVYYQGKITHTHTHTHTHT